MTAVYQGTADPRRGLGVVLGALRNVRAIQADEVKLLMVVRSGGLTTEQLARFRMEEGVTVTVDAAQADVVAATRAAGVAMAYVPSGLGYAHQPALKLLDGVASGRVCITTPNPAHETWARQGAVVITDDHDVESLTWAWLEAIDRARSGPPQGLMALREQWSWDAIMERYWRPAYADAVQA